MEGQALSMKAVMDGMISTGPASQSVTEKWQCMFICQNVLYMHIFNRTYHVGDLSSQPGRQPKTQSMSNAKVGAAAAQTHVR